MAIPEKYQSGEVLHGNDFTAAQIDAWFESERHGYFSLIETLYTGGYSYRALNRMLGGPLRDRRYETCLALGCADGEDVLALQLEIGRIVAIEPAEEWHAGELGGIPADFRVPALDGTLDLPDESVDLAVSLGVLHHIPNVEHVVAEMGRVLKPGGRLLIREPITSMGDWTSPRHGLTRHERGIPPTLMAKFIESAGLALDRRQFLGAGIPQALAHLGLAAYNSRIGTVLDMATSSLLSWNVRYWRPRTIDKLGPAMAAWWATKPG